MDDSRLLKILWIAASLVMGAGIFMSVGTIKACSESLARSERKIREYRDLELLEARAVLHNTALAQFNKLDHKRLVSLKNAVQCRFPESNPDDVRETLREAAPGWFVHDAETALNRVDLSDVMAFAADLEKNRPPWVLGKCVLTASSAVDGKGNAVLTFTGVATE